MSHLPNSAQDFTVRVYVNGSAPMVLKGSVDPFGPYIEVRPNSSPRGEFRLSPRPDQMRALPPGSDADFEFVEPIPADKF